MAEEILKQAPIDLGAIAKKLWTYRKLYYKILPTVLVVTYLITLCVPRYYTCEVSLAPESTGTSAGGSLSSLASSFGLGSLSKLNGNNDAINAELYPDLFKSNDFVVKLLPVEVKTKDGSLKCNYYTYLRDHQSCAPWDWVRGKISELIKPTPKDNFNGKDKINPFYLTKKQSDIFEDIKGNIKCKVDKKTDVVSITVKDQDPLIAATMADEVCKKLQAFIVEYRTHKARIDYNYYKKLCAEAKARYERTRQLYGSYYDSNMDLVLESIKSKTEDLENDMQLKYNIYSTLNNQMQMAQAKLQEATPAFTILQSATVPVKPAGPKRILISIGMTIFTFLVLSCRIFMCKR